MEPSGQTVCSLSFVGCNGVCAVPPRCFVEWQSLYADRRKRRPGKPLDVVLTPDCASAASISGLGPLRSQVRSRHYAIRQSAAAILAAEAQLNDRHVALALINDLPELHLDLVPACLAPDSQSEIGLEIVAGGRESTASWPLQLYLRTVIPFGSH